MRVLHCIWRMSVGGAERQLGYLVRGMVKRGIDVHVALVFRGTYALALEEAGATVHTLVGSKRDPLVAVRLATLCRSLRPSAVNTWLTQMDILGGLAAKTTRTPWILSERNSGPMYPPSLLNTARRGLGIRASAIIANSEGGAEYWRRAGAKGSVDVIQNIVPTEQLQQSGSTTEMRTVESDHPMVLFVGRLAPEKDPSTFLEAVAIASRSLRIAVVICGEGILRTQLEQRAQELSIAHFTTFLGEVADPWHWMRRASALVSSSIVEGTPNVVLEAITVGTPLVLSEIPAHRAIADDSSALFGQPRSASEIAAKIVVALSDPVAARRRAEHARTTIGSRSQDKICEEYESVYRRIGRAS